MSYLLGDPEAFVDQMVTGFVAAHHGAVRRVPGGVARSSPTSPGQVAVVIGGGSGHYPAFAGLVGPGLAHGAAMGQVFASPSAQQVVDVARAVESGGGVLLSYGNYAGDVLNFDQAQRRLRSAGIACETVLVTDDISSAPPGDEATRRGIAGDLFVFKVAAAAAEEGASLAEVTRVATRANAHTRTLGVAFSGCTLPGAGSALFTLPAGRMGVGMGIHGEPGIDEADVPSARDLARLLVDRVLAERPDTGTGQDDRVTVLINGLGSVKGEELYLLFGEVYPLLAERGLRIVDPEVGELVTSFEMAGVSLTVCWLDEELERLWNAPAAAPGYRKGAVTPASAAPAPPAVPADSAKSDPDHAQVVPGTPASRACAAVVTEALDAARQAVEESADELGRLDAIAGDGDHGIGMVRGATAAVRAARAAAEQGAGAGTTLSAAGTAWANRAGGTSGALWQVALQALADTVGDREPVTAQACADGVRAACDAVMAAGKAVPGDKTMVDVLLPFSDALSERVAGGEPLHAAWTQAARTATQAATDTAAMSPRRGRARSHAAASHGVPDAGATSLATVITAVARVLDGSDTNGGIA